MQADPLSLERFYAGPLGRAAGAILTDRICSLWEAPNGLRVLGLGYALPVLAPFCDRAQYVIAGIGEPFGAVRWTGAGKMHGKGNASVQLGDYRLPFADESFDRIVILHGLEETSNARAYLRELYRIMAPEGRIIIVAANRSGVWASTDKTPFGRGRPWTKAQLITLFSGGLFNVTASTHALFLPPINWSGNVRAASAWERIGRLASPSLGGVVLIEAVKSVLIRTGGGAVAPIAEKIRGRQIATNSGQSRNAKPENSETLKE